MCAAAAFHGVNPHLRIRVYLGFEYQIFSLQSKKASQLHTLSPCGSSSSSTISLQMKTENKAAKSEISQVLSKVLSEYQKNKSKKLLMVDGLIVYALATAIVQVISTETKRFH